MTDPTRIPLDAVQPSQLYVDAGRLRAALEWFDPDDPSYDPVPVVDLAAHVDDAPTDRPVPLDGHTRCLLAHLAGECELRVERVAEPDPDLDMELYAECVRWCLGEGVTGVSGLVGRVVSTETFEERWIRRCQASPLYSGDGSEE